jgi:hypothetical protein
MKDNNNMKLTEKQENIITNAVGASILNNRITEDFVLGYLSSNMELTDELKLEVKRIVDDMKKYLVVSK